MRKHNTLVFFCLNRFLDRMEMESFCHCDYTTNWNTEEWGVEYQQQK
jgi:hypothetical protein